MKEKDSRVSLAEKICYGLSSLGGNLPNYILVCYFSLFTTDVLGIGAGVVGTIMLVCSFLDAVTDLFITNLADKIQTPWGKYRPWLLFSGLPMILILVFMFSCPAFLTTNRAKVIWVFIGYFLFSPIFLTGYLCPQYVMISVMTDNEKQRISFGSARSVGEVLSDFLVNGCFMALILLVGGGDYRDAGAWQNAVGVFAAVSAVCCIAGFAGTRERVTVTNSHPDGSVISLRQKLSLLVSSRVYRKVLLLNIAIMVPAIETILFSYFCIYVLGRNDWISPLAVISSLANLIAALFLPLLCRKADLQRLISLGSFFIFIGGILCFRVTSFFTAVLFCVCKGFGYGLTITCSGILWASTADYIERKHELAIPGLVMSAGSFISKLAFGVCGWFATVILVLGKYDQTAAVQSVGTIAWIRNGIAFSLLAGALLTILANRALHEFRDEGML